MDKGKVFILGTEAKAQRERKRKVEKTVRGGKRETHEKQMTERQQREREETEIPETQGGEESSEGKAGNPGHGPGCLGRDWTQRS